MPRIVAAGECLGVAPLFGEPAADAACAAASAAGETGEAGEAGVGAGDGAGSGTASQPIVSAPGFCDGACGVDGMYGDGFVPAGSGACIDGWVCAAFGSGCASQPIVSALGCFGADGVGAGDGAAAAGGSGIASHPIVSAPGFVGICGCGFAAAAASFDGVVVVGGAAGGVPVNVVGTAGTSQPIVSALGCCCPGA